MELVVNGAPGAWEFVSGEILSGVSAPWVLCVGAATITHMLTVAGTEAVRTADRTTAWMIAGQLGTALGDAPEALQIALDVTAGDGPAALESAWASCIDDLADEERALVSAQLAETYHALRSRSAERVVSVARW